MPDPPPPPVFGQLLGRTPEECEFVPPDYFRVLEKSEIFPDPTRPLEIDLGCGDGGFVAAMAEHFPGRDFLGVERLLGRVRKVARAARTRQLPNLKVLRLESGYSLRHLLPTGGVSRLHLLCPDPWPKAKHHKNRIFRHPDFQSGLRRILVPNTGEFLLKTDHPEYFEDALETIAAEMPWLTPLGWPEDDFFYAETDFERQWKAEGKTLQRARWQIAP